jgi:hypothetical protein
MEKTHEPNSKRCQERDEFDPPVRREHARIQNVLSRRWDWDSIRPWHRWERRSLVIADRRESPLLLGKVCVKRHCTRLSRCCGRRCE